MSIFAAVVLLWNVVGSVVFRQTVACNVVGSVVLRQTVACNVVAGDTAAVEERFV